MFDAFTSPKCGRPTYFLVLLLSFCALWGSVTAPPRFEANVAKSLERGIARYGREGFEKKNEEEFRDAMRRFHRDGPYPTPSMVAEAQQRDSMESLYAHARVATRLIALLLLIWAVLARLRDTGWPMQLMLLVFAPVIAMKLFGGFLPQLPFLLLAGTCVLMLLALGTLPGDPGEPEDDEPDAPAVFKPPPRAQFGRRA